MPARLRGVQPLGPGGWRPIFRVMCGRVRLSSDVSEIKLVFPIPPKSANPVVRYDVMWRAKSTTFGANIGAHRSGKVVKLSSLSG